MRAWTLIPLALLLSACTTGEDALTEEDVFVTYLGSNLPQAWTLVTIFSMLGDEESCPAIVQDSDTQWTLTGDCSTATEEWTGSAVYVESADATSATFDFDGFGSQGADITVALTGDVEVDELDVFTADLTASFDPGTGEAMEIEYTGWELVDFQTWLDGAMGNEASASLSGAMDIDTMASFDVDATWTQDGTCADEWSEGTQTLTGASAGDIVFTWGDPCDGCASWTHDDLSGEACD